MLLRHLHDEILDRLAEYAVHPLQDDLGTRNLKLVAFPAHRFDQDCKVQLAPSTDPEALR